MNTQLHTIIRTIAPASSRMLAADLYVETMKITDADWLSLVAASLGIDKPAPTLAEIQSAALAKADDIARASEELPPHRHEFHSVLNPPDGETVDARSICAVIFGVDPERAQDRDILNAAERITKLKDAEQIDEAMHLIVWNLFAARPTSKRALGLVPARGIALTAADDNVRQMLGLSVDQWKRAAGTDDAAGADELVRNKLGISEETWARHNR